MSRRNLLCRLGLGSGSFLLFSKAGWAMPKMSSSDLFGWADQIQKTPRDRIFAWAGEMISQGMDSKTLLGAVFLAGLRDIKPWHVGGKLHAVIMVASIFDLNDSASREERWLGALWNLDDFKRSQERDRREGDWVLGPKPKVSYPGEGKARADFLAAMASWDFEKADHALVGLLPFHNRQSIFEVLWPLAARCYVNIGHKIIYAAQLERTLQRLDWRYAEPALRSLVLGLLFRAPGRLEAFEQSQELIKTFPANWQNGKAHPESSMSLAVKMRLARLEEAQLAVVQALKEGLATKTIWDGLLLFASEIFLRHPQADRIGHRNLLLPVHALTVTNAFGHAWRQTQRESTRRLLLMQACAFLILLRDDLGSMIQLSMEGPGIDELGKAGSAQGVTLEQCFAAYNPHAAKILLEQKPNLAPAFRKQMRTALYQKGVEHHQHKYVAAAWEESLRVHPRWQAHLLAPAVTYLNPNEADTRMLKRSRELLSQAGR